MFSSWGLHFSCAMFELATNVLSNKKGVVGE